MDVENDKGTQFLFTLLIHSDHSLSIEIDK